MIKHFIVCIIVIHNCNDENNSGKYSQLDFLNCKIEIIVK